MNAEGFDNSIKKFIGNTFIFIFILIAVLLIAIIFSFEKKDLKLNEIQSHVQYASIIEINQIASIYESLNNKAYNSLFVFKTVLKIIIGIIVILIIKELIPRRR